jgi:sugar O-acyltransferase (sialic acid O-acetyltransferase NeuD family)
MEKIVLLGAGGHALSIIDSIGAMEKYEIVGISDPHKNMGETVAGVEVLGDDSILETLFAKGIQNAFIAVGSTGSTLLRRKLYRMLQKIGFHLPAIIDPSSNIARNVLIKEGVFIGKGSIINTAGEIREMAIINTGAILEHHCYIGEFVHIGPGAVLCGDVRVNAQTHIGANATVIQGLTIGENSIIGAGSVVVKDVPSGVTAYGNPCKVVRINENVHHS